MHACKSGDSPNPARVQHETNPARERWPEYGVRIRIISHQFPRGNEEPALPGPCRAKRSVHERLHILAQRIRAPGNGNQLRIKT